MKIQPPKAEEVKPNILNGDDNQKQEQDAAVIRSSQQLKPGKEPSVGASADASILFSTSASSTANAACNTNQVANKCFCQSCLERRSIEAEQLSRRLRHAWTQVRHVVYCAYFGPYTFSGVDSEEFKSYVDLLVSQDSHLLYCRIESTSRDYVNGIKTRLLKQLTNGFNTPVLACSFVDALFDEYTRLINSAKTVSSFLHQLEEQYLSHFNNATWEMHNMNLFQTMVFNVPAIHRTFAEIVQQLRTGSAHCDLKHENKYTVALMRFLRFETKMQEMCVQWRDIQIQIDEFHDHRLEVKQKLRQQKPPAQKSDALNKWEFYKIQEETTKQLMLLKSKKFKKKADEAKLSLTLRKCLPTDAPSSDQFAPNSQSATVDDNDEDDDESETDPPYDSPVQSDGSLSEALYPGQLGSALDVTNMPLCAEYLQNIHPPSVPSGDSDDSSDGSSPVILERPNLTVPLEYEDTSLLTQPCDDTDSNSMFRLDGQQNILLNPASRSFILPTFHHATAPYHTHHLHQWQKQLLNPSEQILNVPKVRPPSPTVKSKTESAPNQPNPLEGLFGNTNETSPFEVTEDNLASPASAVFRSTASEILADLPQMIKSTANRVSNITSLVENLCKDAWSSPSSSSSASRVTSTSSSGKDSLAKRPRHKHVKLKKKKKSMTRTNHKSTENNAKENSVQASALDVSGGGQELKKEVAPMPVAEKGSSEKDDQEEESDLEEDADDEYDGEDDADEVCKCSKCRQLTKSYKASSQSQIEDFKQQFLSQDVRLDNDDEPEGPCKCAHCLQLATASFIAAHTSKAPSNLATFNPIDPPDPSIHPPFYNTMQNIHSPSPFMIHPHLYGLQAMSGGNAMVHSFEPVVSSSSGSTKQSGDVGKCGGSPQKEDVGSPESKPSHPGGLFQHLNSASSDWDIFGKSPNSKFVLNSTGQSNENSISMADWSTSNHQAWLNNTGSGVLPPHFIPPAFQHYINNSSLSGTPGFFPLMSGSTHLPHPGMHSSTAFFPTLADGDGLYNSTAEAAKTSSSSNSTSTSPTTQQTSSKSSSVSPASSSASSSIGSPGNAAIFTPSSSPYFPPTMYTQIPGLTTNTISPFPMSPPNSTNSASAAVTTSTQSTSPPQAMHFHPGSSVSLKDAHFNLPLHENANLIFNPSHFSTGDRQGITSGASQNLFNTPSISQASCIQHNPFLQPIPISTPPHSTSCYPNVQGQNPSGGQTNINNLPTTVPTSSAANAQHIRQQILRRKKLVAHSKLAKQKSPHQLNHKMNEQNSASESQTQGFQKLQHQISLTPPKTPNQSPQAGSQKLVNPSPKQLDQAPNASASTTPNPLQNKENIKPPDKYTNMAQPKQNSTPKQVNAASNASGKHEVQLHAPTSDHIHPPNYHHVSGDCHENQEDGSANESAVSAAHHDGHGGENPSNNNGAANSNCKYCNCCYCEFFGNGGPAPTPTSKNYTEMREKLLRKLHTKTKKSTSHGKTKQNRIQEHPALPEHGQVNHRLEDTSVEEWLHFIEGEKNSQENGGKKTKKSKQKHKRDSEKAIEEALNPTAMVDKVLEKENRTALTSDSSVDEKIGSSKFEKAPNKVLASSVKSQTPTLDLPDADEKVSSKKKKKKKQGEKSNDPSCANKAFLEDPSLPVSVTARKNPASSPEPSSLNRLPDKVKPKPSEESRKHDSNKTPQERKAKADLKKAPNKPVPNSTEKPPQNTLQVAIASKSSTKKGKTTAKVESSLANHKTEPNVDAILARQAKDKSQNKRMPAEQITNQRTQNTVEASQKQGNRKKSTKPTQKSPSHLQEKIVVNGQDHVSSCNSGAPNSQSRDKNVPKESPKPTKAKEQRNFPVSTNRNQENSDNKSTSEQEKLTDNGVDSKKSRLRKSRKKNGRKFSFIEKNEMVDQVFLPREALEEDSKELDDTEKEIDNFKRFCLDCSAKNKQKKISVNWKEFNFKKNNHL